MNVTPEVASWLRKANSDLAAAFKLAESDIPFPDQTGFFCQQAAEKYLKAYLVAAGQLPPRIHDIDALLDLCAEFDPAFDDLHSVVEGLTEFAVIFRYPGEWSESELAAQALTQAEMVRAAVQEKLNLEEEIE